jgi:hypothetical protein
VLKLVNGTTEYIPDQKIKGRKVIMVLPKSTIAPGHYVIAAGDNQFLTIALNLDTDESDINPLNVNELQTAFEGFNYALISGSDHEEIITNITKEYKGIELWRYFLALALVFLLVEVLLIRLL